VDNIRVICVVIDSENPK